MDIFSITRSLSRHCRRRCAYNRLSPKSRRNMKVARLGAAKRSWRLRLGPKLRLIRIPSPSKLWHKLKNMLRLTHGSGSSNSVNAFGTKRIPRAEEVPMANYSRAEFENRLIFEIYKSVVASFELGYTKHT